MASESVLENVQSLCLRNVFMEIIPLIDYIYKERILKTIQIRGQWFKFMAMIGSKRLKIMCKRKIVKWMQPFQTVNRLVALGKRRK